MSARTSAFLLFEVLREPRLTPFEEWSYKHFEGVGNLTVEFVDTTSSRDFRMTLDPKEKYKKP